MLKISVLVDNTVLVGSDLLAEAGISLWLECGGAKILFDTGYSDLFLRNARLMGIDAAAPDAVVLSHGDNDHTWGLLPLMRERSARGLSGSPRLFCHPDAFLRKRCDGVESGMATERDVLDGPFRLCPSREPVEVAERLWWLGEIEPRITPRYFMGERLSDGAWEPDCCLDDSALVYDGNDGLVIITGCSHSGICNIAEQAKLVTGREKIADVVGGFHLLKGTDEETGPVISYFKANPPRALHACHCTCFRARAAFAASFGYEEFGAGCVLEYE